jgi:hypothetical protein
LYFSLCPLANPQIAIPSFFTECMVPSKKREGQVRCCRWDYAHVIRS